MTVASPTDPAAAGRAQGCLVGQLAGDSLGSLVEFQDPGAIRKAYPGGVRQLADGGTWNTLAGQPTDDSEMALALARTLVRERRFDLESTARAYVHWFRSGPFDIGNTCRTALAAGARGTSAAQGAQASAKRGSQANGALMRISPLAIFGAHAEEAQLIAWARDDASLTHPHPNCLAANAAFCVAVARAIRSGEDPVELHARALRVAADQPDAAEIVTVLERAAAGPPEDFTHLQGWVCLALQNAFYQLLHAPDPEAGLVDTVGRGGDTDTNGAIAGALLGATWGVEAVPGQWRECLRSCRPGLDNPLARHPRPEAFWPCDAEDLAVQLLTALPTDSATA